MSAAPDAAHTTLGRRLAACAYDALAVVGVLVAAGVSVLPLTGGTAIEPGSPWQLPFRAYLALAVYLYFALSWRRGGQTLGMRAWRLRLRRVDGGAPTWEQTAVRFALAVLSWAALGAGFWWSLFDGERRTWHDRGSGTRIVHEPRAT